MSSSTPPDFYTRSVSRLASLFYPRLEELGHFEPIRADELPDDYRTLLAHHDHMTVTLEAFHNSLMDVRVLDERQDDTSYARKILLARQSDGLVVQFGIMRIWPADLTESARQEIASKKLPLGRVLLRHNVLREVELTSIWKILPGSELQELLELSEGETIFGRSAQILVHDRPTVQLLEIVMASRK